MHSFDRVINSIISASKRNDPVNYKKISDKMLRLCYSRDLSPHMVNRYFFLLGSDFCQNLKCDECFLSESCYLFPYDSVYFKAVSAPEALGGGDPDFHTITSILKP